MKKMIMSTGLRWLWLALVVLTLDLISKQWVITHFWLGESIPIISFVNFTYSHNHGGAFSFLADKGGWQRWAFSAIAVIISVVLLIMMYRSDKRISLSNIAYMLIIGGALGNLFDRLVHGMVIDFIDFYINDWHWPTFNVADASICIGAILIILDGFPCSVSKTAR